MTPIKKCTKCGGEFPATTEYFYKYQQGFFGLSCWCKSCRRIYNRLWRDTRQEKERAYNRQYYLGHIEKKRANDKKRRAANRERGRENNRRWHAAHPEKNRTYCKQRRDANLDK